MAEMAVTKATNPEVKSFAQKIVADHTKANDELMSLASTKGLNLSNDTKSMAMHKHNAHPGNSPEKTADRKEQIKETTPDSNMRKMEHGMDYFSGLSGVEFDRELMKAMLKDDKIG